MTTVPSTSRPTPCDGRLCLAFALRVPSPSCLRHCLCLACSIALVPEAVPFLAALSPPLPPPSRRTSPSVGRRRRPGLRLRPLRRPNGAKRSLVRVRAATSLCFTVLSLTFHCPLLGLPLPLRRPVTTFHDSPAAEELLFARTDSTRGRRSPGGSAAGVQAQVGDEGRWQWATGGLRCW